MMRISIIAAMDKNRVIGLDNMLPWYIPRDLKWFRKHTLGKPIVMGRKTHETIGEPLPGRQNLVVTRNREYEAPGCTVVHSIQQALQAAGDVDEVMFIGGEEIYNQIIERADRLYLTLIEAEFEGDSVFPRYEQDEWTLLYREYFDGDDRSPYRLQFLILDRKGARQGPN